MWKSTREKRERLFGKSRPTVRKFDPASDMWVLWAAYDLGSFKRLPAGMDRKSFEAYVMNAVARHSGCFVIDDDCRYFKSGRGPMCFVAMLSNGWKVEPYADFFMWAKARRRLRCVAAFLQMIRYSKEIGVCVVTALADSVNLLNRMKRYGLLFLVGRIPDGSGSGDEFVYQLRCAKKV